MRKNILLIILFFFLQNSGFSLTFVVTSNTDSNPMAPLPGELRFAIQQANLTPGLDNIVFNIPLVTPSTITLASFLSITDPVIIDGSTQPANGYPGPEPKIWISGNSTLTQG